MHSMGRKLQDILTEIPVNQKLKIINARMVGGNKKFPFSRIGGESEIKLSGRIRIIAEEILFCTQHSDINSGIGLSKIGFFKTSDF